MTLKVCFSCKWRSNNGFCLTQTCEGRFGTRPESLPNVCVYGALCDSLTIFFHWEWLSTYDDRLCLFLV